MIWMPYAAPLATCWARCSPAGRTSGPPPCRPWAGGWGGFIYLMDAYDDRPKDARKGSVQRAAKSCTTPCPPLNLRDRCHDLLTQQMGLCAQQFELLPILKETPEGKLLYNTIYSGVWSKYAPIRKHREGEAEMTDPYRVLGITPGCRRRDHQKSLPPEMQAVPSPTCTPTTHTAEEHLKKYRPPTARSCG